jgi:hypothetical protein
MDDNTLNIIVEDVDASEQPSTVFSPASHLAARSQRRTPHTPKSAFELDALRQPLNPVPPTATLPH